MQSKQAKARRAAILKKKFGGRYPTMSQQHKDLIPIAIDSVSTKADSSKYKKKKGKPAFLTNKKKKPKKQKPSTRKKSTKVKIARDYLDFSKTGKKKPQN